MTTKSQSTTEPIEVPERIWIAPTTIRKREGRIYLAPGRKDNEIEYAHVHTSVQKNEGGEVGGSDIERPRQIFDAGFTAAASPLAVEQSDGWPSEAANKIADYFNAPPSVIPAIERIIQRCAVPAPSAAVQDETELTKLRQAIGWICDAADAAYIEDSDNARIHEIFNIAAQAAGITRRLPDEYQRFDESGSE